jgi:hypothetical protein
VATFNKIDAFVENLAEKVHNLGSDDLRLALSNTAPTAASTLYTTGSFPVPAAANGYPSGGGDLTIFTSAQTSGTYKLCITDFVFTATAGGIGPFQYAILYNNTATNKEIVGWYNCGSAITLADTDTLTVDFDGTNGVLTLA